MPCGYVSAWQVFGSRGRTLVKELVPTCHVGGSHAAWEGHVEVRGDHVGGGLAFSKGGRMEPSSY